MKKKLSTKKKPEKRVIQFLYRSMTENKGEKLWVLLDIVFAAISLTALAFLFSSVKHEITEIMFFLSNLPWYWYGLVFLLAAIHPLVHILKYVKRGRRKV